MFGMAKDLVGKSAGRFFLFQRMGVFLSLLELLDDFLHLLAEADGVALLDEDDAVEAVADEEDGEGGGGEVHLPEDLGTDVAVDVGAPDGGGGEALDLTEVEPRGALLVLEEEHELATPALEVLADEGDVAEGVVRGLVVGGDEADGVVTAAAGGEEG